MNYILYALVAIIVVAGGWWLINNQDALQGTDDTSAGGTMLEGTATGDETAGTDADLGQAAGPDVTVDVEGSPFAFDVKEIRVREGDTVQINFTNTQGSHDWVLDEFGVRTAVLAAGASESVTFVADKKGTFEYYCSVGNHRAQGMVGKLIVE